MNAEKLGQIVDAVVRSWSAETSATPEKWTPDNPALGQCAVTACVIQDYAGGDILNSTVTLPDGSTDSHYFNVIDGEEVDLTKRQFPEGSRFTEGQPKTKDLKSTRDYCLSYDDTRKRYEILKEKVKRQLGN